MKPSEFEGDNSSLKRAFEKAVFVPSVQKYKDEPLEKLLAVLNEQRDGVKYKKLTFARLNKMLQTLDKSKKNWSRDILIGNIMDAKNPAKYFWFLIKNK